MDKEKIITSIAVLGGAVTSVALYVKLITNSNSS